jgi:hypothetical protein
VKLTPAVDDEEFRAVLVAAEARQMLELSANSLIEAHGAALGRRVSVELRFAAAGALGTFSSGASLSESARVTRGAIRTWNLLSNICHLDHRIGPPSMAHSLGLARDAERYAAWFDERSTQQESEGTTAIGTAGFISL